METAIAKRRKAMGLTQRDLSVKLDCTITTISLYEKGAFKPNGDKLCKLAKIFGISAEKLASELERDN